MRTMPRTAFAGILLLIVALVPGCIVIHVSELRLKLNDEGGGEAILRLVDLRSDAPTDSLVTHDFGVMMASFEKEGVDEFEQEGRKIISKRLIVSGDTLSAEIIYSFPEIAAVQGLHATKDEYFFVVDEGREIVKTNGRIESWEHNTRRIVWDRGSKRMYYQIREKDFPRAASLVPLYLKYNQ